MMRVKQPAVAGLFYPQDPEVLAKLLNDFLEGADPPPGPRPHALIVPHAGYVYSGPIAATGYATLRPWRGQITRVAVLAPSHRVAFRGIATSSADRFATPLGEIPVDRDAVAALDDLPGVGVLDQAFAEEHALEVQLPFLQSVLGDFTLVPLVVGQADAETVDRVIEALQREDTLFVVSSDLSHYHDYATCQSRDRETSAAIVRMDEAHIGPRDACGAYPIGGLLMAARDQAWQPKALDVRNSGDTAGDRARVVGYGAYAFF
jgi:hypothetical protein